MMLVTRRASARTFLRMLGATAVGVGIQQLASQPASAQITEYSSGTTPDITDRSLTVNGDVSVAGGGVAAAPGNLSVAGAITRPNGAGGQLVVVDSTGVASQAYYAP